MGSPLFRQMHYQPTSLATAAPSRPQRGIALLLACLLAMATVLLWRRAADAALQLPVFVGAYESAVIVCDFLTASLLFIQFSQFRCADVLILACGYFLTALVVAMHLASFPGVFARAGLMGGGTQTTPWLWNFWHSVFPLSAFFYSVVRRQVHANPHVIIACSVLAISICAFCIFKICTDYALHWPPLMDGVHFTSFYNSFIYLIISFFSIIAILSLLLLKKPQSTISIYLSLAVFAFLLDVLNNWHSEARYAIGWYLGRANSLLASVVLCTVFVTENAFLLRYANIAADQLAAFNAALQAANASKTRFFAAASHDLRQPFQAMRLFHSALDGTALGHRQRQMVDGLGQAMTSAEELLAELLDTARLENAMLTVQLRPVDLGAMIAELKGELGPVARERGLKLRAFAVQTSVSTDALLLRRVLTNLLANAIRYTEKGGVLIGVRRRKGRVFAEVWDTGIGISDDQANYIFEEFYQIGNSNRDRSLGLGLGLSIVKQLCEALGCEITVRSRLGKGSLFRVSIPGATQAPGASNQLVPRKVA